MSDGDDEAMRWASAVDMMRLLSQGRTSATELHDLAIARIETLDRQLNSVVIPLFERPKEGIPLLIKDAGQEIAATSHWVGSRSLRDHGSRSQSTTALVELIERSGFSVIGKAACPALSNGATTEPDGFPPTRNPWNPDMSAGGSSGGSAAAVAAGLVPVAHGSDSVGSLRIPAALCGVSTLVPSRGDLVAATAPAGGPGYLWRDFFLSRHVEDLELMYDVLGGHRASPSSSEAVRVGLLAHDPAGELEVEKGCAEAALLVARALEDFGHQVEHAWPTFLSYLPQRSDPHLRVLSDAVRPPVHRWLARRLGRPVLVDDVGQLDLDAAARARARPWGTASLAHLEMMALVNEIEAWWGDHDLLVTPATFQPAWRLGTTPTIAHIGPFLAPFSFTGQPAVCIPMFGFTDGLPRGVQIVGRHGSDRLLLAIARELEEVFRVPDRHPPDLTAPAGN